MVEAALLVLAMVGAVVGMGWLALAMPAHWAQVAGDRPLGAGHATALRALGALALGASGAACLAADHPSMAVLVWVMQLAVAAIAVAMTLSWRPRWLSWLSPGAAHRPAAH